MRSWHIRPKESFSAAETTRTDDTDTRKTTTYVSSSRWTVWPRRRLPWYKSLIHKYSNVHKGRTLHLVLFPSFLVLVWHLFHRLRAIWKTILRMSDFARHRKSHIDIFSGDHFISRHAGNLDPQPLTSGSWLSMISLHFQSLYIRYDGDFITSSK